MMNTRAAMLTCDNKLTTILLFEKYGLPTPKTAYVSNENNIKTALDMIGGKFPIILKTLTGTQGVGVIKIESYEGLVDQHFTSDVETRVRSINTKLWP